MDRSITGKASIRRTSPFPPNVVGGCTSDSQPQQPTPDQVASIQEYALKNLCEAKYSLDDLLVKVRGPVPSDTKVTEGLDRTLVNDARTFREYSYDILDRIQELHRVIGPTS